MTAHKQKLHGVPVCCFGCTAAFAKVRLVFYLGKCAGCYSIFYERCARVSLKRSNSCCLPPQLFLVVA